MSCHKHICIISLFAMLALAACAGPDVQPTPLLRDNLMYARQPDVQFQPTSNPTAIFVTAGGRQDVDVGDAVTVDADGQARLRFSDFLVIDVYRDTQLSGIQYTGSVDANAPPAFKMRLEGGSMFSNLNAQVIAGQRVTPRQEIDTDWAVIQALGTRYWVHYDPDREMTWVVVKEGVVSVTGAGVEVMVQAGQQTWVEPGQPPVAPIPACRNLIGDLFPLIDELTNQDRPDLELLCQNGEEPGSVQLGTPTPAAETPTPVSTQQPTRAAQPAPTNEPMPLVNCPVIELTGPDEGAVFRGILQNVTLTWRASRPLAPGEYYVVTSYFDHNGEMWEDNQQTGQDSFTLPVYLNDLLTGRRQLDWNVSVWRQNGGEPGTQICPNSASRRLTWEPSLLEPPTPTDTPTPYVTPTPTTYPARLAEPASPSQLTSLATILGAGFLLAVFWIKDGRREE